MVNGYCKHHGEEYGVGAPSKLECQSENDNRIMLHMLLTEARRFHAHMGSSQRRPVSVSRCAMSSGSSSASNNSSFGSSSFASSASQSSNTQTTSSNDSPREMLGADDHYPVYDEWNELQSQIDLAWCSDRSHSPQAKYQRIKGLLTCLFMWDGSRAWDEFEEVSSSASLEWIASRQRARLAALPPGALFHIPPLTT